MGFIRVKRVRMLATLLVVYLRKEHLLQTKDIVAATTRSGIAGVLVSVALFTILDLRKGFVVCFVLTVEYE